MARDYSGCEVWLQDFLKLDLPPSRFDGVFANAALFHVPSQELPRVLARVRVVIRANDFTAPAAGFGSSVSRTPEVSRIERLATA